MSSESRVNVVRIGKVGKHPNADSLSITQIYGGYPVIFRTGTYNEGDLAVYIPVDSMVPRTEYFDFLFDEKNDKEYVRVKAKKLRGVFSMGLLIPIPDGMETEFGRDVSGELGIKKYEPILTFKNEDAVPHPALPCSPSHYDIEGLRRYQNILTTDEDVVITEKIHGANMRVCYWQEAHHVGGRTQWLNTSGNSPYAIALRNDSNLYNFVEKHPGLVVFGEVYGKVQNLRYGLDNNVAFRAFDIWDSHVGRWLNYNDFITACGLFEINTVPELYRGPWTSLEEVAPMAEGNSTLANHVREGIVIKPTVERWDDTIGRVILKLHGTDYLLSKGH